VGLHHHSQHADLLFAHTIAEVLDVLALVRLAVE